MNKIVWEIIRDIVEYNPFDGDYVKVAQLGSYQVKGLNSSKDTNTVLLSPSLIAKIKPSHINVPVKSTARDYSNEYIYKPSFNIYLSPSSGLKKTEPFVVSWDTGNHTILSPDHGFLQAYKLIPRLTEDVTFWDDISKPEYNIVENKPCSCYNFPHHSEAYVKVNQDYFKDYLFLRKKVAVLVFQEKRDILINDEIEELLGQEGYYISETETYELRLSRHAGKQEIAQLEVNGFQILFNPFSLKTVEEPKWKGHKWLGIDELITGFREESLRLKYGYVSDDVLSKYEGDSDYEVYPQSGSVQYRNQWSVSYCERIGRDAIKIELKKLYEGTPYRVIDYWNQFSLDPSTINKEEKNIATRAENLVQKYFLFSRLMSGVINEITNLQTLPSDIIRFDEPKVKNEGILQNSTIQTIAYHVSNKSFKKAHFTSRCKELYKVFIENLREDTLRKCVNQLGFDTEVTKYFRSTKLLDLILSYLIATEESGLSPKKDSLEIISRINEKSQNSLVKEFFALNDLRQLDAHQSKDSFKNKFNNSLQVFDISPNSLTNNYASVCDQVYDKLDDCFININRFLVEAHRLL